MKIADFLNNPITHTIGNDIFPGLGTIAQIYSGVHPTQNNTPVSNPSPAPSSTPQPQPSSGASSASSLQGADYFKNIVANDPDLNKKAAAQGWLNRNGYGQNPGSSTNNMPNSDYTAPTAPVSDYTAPSVPSAPSVPNTPSGNINSQNPYTIERYKEDVNQPNPSEADLARIAYGLNNARNDVATGAVDPYNLGVKSGIPFSPDQLAGIEKGIGGSFDPALNDVNARILQKQDEAKLAAQYGTMGNNSDISDYYDLSPSGYNYIDLSKLTTDQKKIIIPAARAQGIPLLDTQEAGKITAIGNARDNIQDISDSLDGLLAKNPVLNILKGSENTLASVFGGPKVKSYKAWRTAIIAQVTALAGGQGSGLRINQAEIDAALKNDLPIIAGPNADTVASAQLKLANLRKQMDNWEKRIIGKSQKNIDNNNIQFPDQGGDSQNYDLQTPDGLKWKVGPDGSYTQVSFNSVGGDTKTAMNIIIPPSSHLAYVNNNPGNIKFANQPGAVLGANGFAKFDSPQAGFNAIIALTNHYANQGHTLASYLSKYAPPSENNTRQYIADVVKQTGINPNIHLANLSSEQKIKLAQAIAVNESSARFA